MSNTSSPPTYTRTPIDIELASLSSALPTTSAPPPYSPLSPASSTTFTPTTTLQIETLGKPWLSLPLPLRPDPIPIFTLAPSPSTSSPSTSTTTTTPAPSYLSLRPTRNSGTSYLAISSPSETEPTRTLSTTTYRFGPNRPPKVRLYHPLNCPTSNPPPLAYDDPTPSTADSPTDTTEDSYITPWETLTITSPSLLTRATTFRSPRFYLAGSDTFIWRYASRKERAALNAHSLLLLERVSKVSRARNVGSSSNDAGGRGKEDVEEVRTLVARFIRNEEYRTKGSGSSSAGNGGRLEIDLGKLCGGDDGGGDGEGDGNNQDEARDDDGRGMEKGRDEMGVVLVVTTALVMLKREVDRRRAQQIAIMAGGAGS